MLAYLAVAARAGLLVVFTVSTASRLRGRRYFLDFADSLRPIVTPRLTRVAAAAITATEANCVVLLAMPATAGYGYLLAGAVLGVLTLAVGWAVVTGRPVTCRCFGVHARPLGLLHVVRNALLFLLALCGLGSGPVPAAAAMVAAAAGGIGALSLISLDDLVELWHPA